MQVGDGADETVTAYVETLFREYRGPLFRYLAGLLPNAEDADELLQETYLRLLRQEGLDHVEANARAYVFQIATNLVRDFFRHRKAHRADQHATLDNHHFERQLQEPEESIQWDDTLARLKTALLSLEPAVCQVFLLHRFSGMTYPQIARTLRIGTRTVERYMSVAVSHLRCSMEWES
jgi:RNA polymerase sigma-70 factor (ECF subfamily)